MSKNLTIFGCIIACLLCVAGGWFMMDQSYNNEEKTLRNKAEAEIGVLEASVDNCWKKIAQVSKASEKYEKAFKESYAEIFSARYEGDNPLMNWIKEDNPKLDSSIYKKIQDIIDSERDHLLAQQTTVLDVIREHKTLCETWPGNWFIKNKTPIEFKVISSTRTKEIMKTGLDDNIDF